MDLPVFPSEPVNSTLSFGEVLGAMSYAIDMTEGQAPGHCMRACLIGVAIGQAMGLSGDDAADLYYTLLLKDLGCSSNAGRICQLYLTDDRSFKQAFKTVDGSMRQALAFVLRHTGPDENLAKRITRIASVLKDSDDIIHDLIDARCQQGGEIARLMGFSDAVVEGIAGLDEHWDGKGRPDRLQGEAIPLFSRIALAAQVMDVLHAAAGADAAISEMRRRSGTWFDPRVAQAAMDVGRDSALWESLGADVIDANVKAKQPRQDLLLMDDDILDNLVHGFARVIDAKSPFTHGHSARVALYADLIAADLGIVGQHARWLRRSALLHDIGKLGISNTILDKPDRLNSHELVTIRAHPGLSFDILSRVSAFKAMARVARAHHERLDGEGYPDRLQADQLSMDMRILTVADIYDALSADRPYSPAKPQDVCFRIMDDMVGSAIDGDIYGALKSGLAKAELNG